MEGVPTYEYMTNLNVYLNSCSSAVDCALGCGTFGCLVLTAQPAVLSTHCGTHFLPATIMSIHLVMPDPAPIAAILSKLVRNHKQEVFLFNKYNAVNWAYNRVISQLIPDKFYKSLLSQIIVFAKVTCLQILTHIITKYAELEDDDIQEIYWRMKEPVSGRTIFK